jgi:hypothetical protein
MYTLMKQLITWYKEAQIRAQRRKSLWNLILIPLSLTFWFGIWYGLFRLVWAFHITFYPQHSLQNFWQENISLSSFVPSFLMVFALMPGSICLGLVLANCIAWIVAPARRVFETESIGYKGTSFREATSTLLILSVWTVSTGLIISLIAAWALVSLK